MRLGTDSGEYEMLEEAIALIPKGPYLSCEIGVRRGGSSQLIMEALKKYSPETTHVAVDCYGQLPYAVTETQMVIYDYTNDMRDETIPELYKIARNLNINFIFFNLTDDEFFRRFGDGVPVYQNQQSGKRAEYNFVFLDGPHTFDFLSKQSAFFVRRMVRGATIVYDDHTFYDYNRLHRYLTEMLGLTLIRKGPDKKVIYQK